MAKGTTFKFDTGAISRLGDRMGRAVQRDSRELELRVKKATEIVWRTAHAKRPMITRAQMKAEGRRRRVSDPGATLGVPVATGRLQASVKQYTRSKGVSQYQGVVETTGVPYAGFMEYGTAKVQARPFMRPAVNLNREVIKREFGAHITEKL